MCVCVCVCVCNCLCLKQLFKWTFHVQYIYCIWRHSRCTFFSLKYLLKFPCGLYAICWLEIHHSQSKLSTRKLLLTYTLEYLSYTYCRYLKKGKYRLKALSLIIFIALISSHFFFLICPVKIGSILNPWAFYMPLNAVIFSYMISCIPVKFEYFLNWYIWSIVGALTGTATLF